MKYLLILLLLCSINCFGDEGQSTDYESMIAPLMPLSEQIPISISRDNRRKYIQNPEITQKQALDNIALVNKHSLPWIPLLSALVVIGAVLIVRVMPPPTKTDVDVDIAKQLKLEAIEELKKVLRLDPEKIKNTNECFALLDHAIRIYCKGQFEIDAPSLTPLELMNAIKTAPNIDDQTKSHLYLFLKNGENIKYGKYSLSLEELRIVIQQAASIIR